MLYPKTKPLCKNNLVTNARIPSSPIDCSGNKKILHFYMWLNNFSQQSVSISYKKERNSLYAANVSSNDKPLQ